MLDQPELAISKSSFDKPETGTRRGWDRLALGQSKSSFETGTRRGWDRLAGQQRFIQRFFQKRGHRARLGFPGELHPYRPTAPGPPPIPINRIDPSPRCRLSLPFTEYLREFLMTYCGYVGSMTVGGTV